MAIVNFYKDIGLDPTFKKTIDFTSKANQLTWFNSKTYTQYDNVNYNKLQNTVKINTDVDFGEALEYTYCVISDLEDTSDRLYFCFVQSVTLITKGTIEFQLVLDPLQTFMGEYTLGECMVTRKHCDRFTPSSSVIKPYPQPDYTPGEQEVTNYTKIEYPSIQFAIISFTNPKLSLDNIFTAQILGNNVFYGIIPINVDNPKQVFKTQVTANGGTVANTRFITLDELCNGEFGTNSCIPTDGILSVSVSKYPGISLYTSGDYYYIFKNSPATLDISVGDTPASFKFTNLEWMPTDGKMSGESYESVMYLITPEMYDSITNTQYLVGDKLIPIRPQDGDTASQQYEPALYMEPFTNRYIVDGKGSQIMKIPDAAVFNYPSARIFVHNLINSGGITDIISYGEMPAGFYGKNAVMGAASEYSGTNLDVVSSAWQNYVLTQRDSDRKMVNDNNWRNAIDNAIFMGYGGSLVASRGASGNDSSAQRQKNILTGVSQAIGMAVGASVVTSVIDAHYAWEAQRAKEQSIKNQPGTIVSSGNGLQQLLDDSSTYYLAITRVNGDALSIAYDTFRKYGYLINKYEVPNVKSRKYFDYILTAGCIIEGSLNGSIKQELATIYDNGITIFHGDYTSTLEYPTEENIERSLL